MRPSADWPKNSSGKFPPIEIDPTVTLTRPMTIRAYEYWQSARVARAMPARKDISPQAMRAFVSHVALVELRAGSGGKLDYVMRLAGARIEDVFGSITGRALQEFMPAQIESRWRWTMDKAVAAAAPLRVSSRVAFGDKTWLQAEVLLAPLGNAGTVSMLFGAIEIWPAAQMGASERLPA